MGHAQIKVDVSGYPYIRQRVAEMDQFNRDLLRKLGLAGIVDGVDNTGKTVVNYNKSAIGCGQYNTI